MRVGYIFYISVVVLLIFASCSSGINGNSNTRRSLYHKNRAAHYKVRNSRRIAADAQCDQLKRKKFNYKSRRAIASPGRVASTKTQPLAEYDPNDTPPTQPPAKPKPQPKPEPVAKAETTPDIDNMNLEEKHDVEDEVLKRNNLPAPTSAKHEEIRKEVQQHLENFENEKPIKLEPLYFVTGQDEFAFVDMDPFLVAVEYALAGKMILIEGHTDHIGDFEANVELSIKRVERIRELMLQMGVHDDHISVVGYGEEHSETSTDSGKKQEERRVDFTVF